VRSLQAELVEEFGDGVRQGGRRRLDLRRQGRGGAEAGQVDGHDVEVLGEGGDDGGPVAARAADAVQQQQGLAGAGAGVRQCVHAPLTAGGRRM